MSNNYFINEESSFKLTQYANHGELSVELAKSFTEMVEAVKRANKSTWDANRSMAKIVDEELFKPTFKSVNEMANKTGINSDLWYRASKAVKNLDKVLSKLGFNETNITVSKCAILASLEKNQRVFLKWIKANHEGVDVYNLGEQKLVKFIKEFKAWLNNEVPTEATEATTEGEATEATTEAKQAVVSATYYKDDEGNETIIIALRGKQYVLTVDELKEYELETE